MYWIVTDSGIDMSKEWIDQQQDFRVLNLTYLMDDTPYVSDGTDVSIKNIYDAMRNGKMLKTDGNIGFEVHEHLIRILYFGSNGWRLPRHYPEWIHEALLQEVTHWMRLPEPPKEV